MRNKQGNTPSGSKLVAGKQQALNKRLLLSLMNIF